jgi:hypothetical protein
MSQNDNAHDRGCRDDGRGGNETVSENSRDASVVDAVGRVTDLHQLADAIVVAAKLMSEAVQEIENELMKITSRLDEQVTHSSTPALSKQDLFGKTPFAESRSGKETGWG